MNKKTKNKGVTALGGIIFVNKPIQRTIISKLLSLLEGLEVVFSTSFIDCLC